jgi:citrate lyase subunit beta/citryl-CoA lyase
MDHGPRRSLLFVPASSETMLRKAGSRGADVLILDLEDGVLPGAKDEARARLETLVGDVDLGPSELFLRVNGAGTHWHWPDLDAAARIQPDGVVLPKCESPDVARAAAERIGKARLFLMVETARGVLAARELAAAPHVQGLLFGAADFRESIRAGRDPDEAELLLARQTLVLAARASGVEAFDTPFFEYRDEEGLEKSARRARTLGFDGKMAIHPAQVRVLNRIFAPTAAEVARARAVVTALESAAAAGRGVAVVDGEMVEPLHLAEARRTLARAGETEDP